MSHSRTRVEVMTPDEIASIAEAVKTHGIREAARLLGLYQAGTLRKALLGEPVQSLTASTIRARLRDLPVVA
jgi:2-iminoacetate synthase ThiH